MWSSFACVPDEGCPVRTEPITLLELAGLARLSPAFGVVLKVPNHPSCGTVNGSSGVPIERLGP